MATLATVQSLVSSLNELCGEYPFHTGWYLKDLRSGEAADRNGDVIVPSASTRKIAILMTALKQVNEGKLTLDQPVTIQSKYQDNTSGCFQHLQPGFTIQFRDTHVSLLTYPQGAGIGSRVPL